MKSVADLPVEIVVGGSLSSLQCKPLVPYADESVRFLGAWSKNLLSHSELRTHPDVAAFAYWCRPSNLARLQREFGVQHHRLGRGLALHIAPANVPVNFAYSFAFGLLAGNANIVRLPERLHAAADLICEVAAELLEQPAHARVAAMTRIVRYPRNDDITRALSSAADVRLLWGGDQTIYHLREMRTPARCVDLAFSDRYSLCVLGAEAVNLADATTLNALVNGFYNDVFFLDQSACSSPQLVLWFGSPSDVIAAQRRFWDALHQLLLSKPLPPGINAVNKYTLLCQTAIMLDGARVEVMPSNLVHRVALSSLPANIAQFRGKHGFFIEATDVSTLEQIVDESYQTLTYFGLNVDQLLRRIIDSGLPGIDRIVPVGKALDIGVFWDGYDLIRSMSRIVEVQ